MLCRNKERADEAAEAIRSKAGPGRVGLIDVMT